MTGSPLPIPWDCPDWIRAWALFLDIDGTLLDLASDPQGVSVPSGLPEQLGTLARGLGGALALVSGRPLSEIDRLFPGNLDAAGTHGAQWCLGGIEDGLRGAADAALAGIYSSLEEETHSLPGVILETKPHAIAVHYRQAPEWEEKVWLLAGQARQALGPGFRLQPGKQVVEILPAEAGKDAAIQRFMGLPHYAGRLPIFIGDDQTDEDGFALVNSLGGCSVRVGEGTPTQARFQLSSPAAVRDWIAGLAASLQSR